MPEPTLAEDVLADLLRSAWVVESARALVYRQWSVADPDMARRAEWVSERTPPLARALDRLGRTPDEGIVERHAAWMSSVVGSHPEEVGLGPFFLARLGDWTEAHASPFLDGTDRDTFVSAGERERTEILFPATLPKVPPFEPLAPVDVEPPGDVILRIGILGDTHFGSKHAARRVGAAIADLNASGAELVIQLGDITDQGESAQFEEAVRSLGNLEMPFVTMMGNHDVWSKTEERLSGIDYYPEHFGRAADGVIVEQAGFRFVVLDSAEHAASPFGPFDMIAGGFTEGPRGAIVRGALSEPQHDLLADVAGPNGGPAFVFLHHPPQPFTSFPPIVFGLRDADSGRLQAVCDSGNVWGIFAGHTHRCAAPGDFEHVPIRELGIPRDYPFGYGLLDIAKDGYAYSFRQLSDLELLEQAYEQATEIHRRYGTGPESSRGFTWERRL